MYEVVRTVKGYDITRMKGTHGFYTVVTYKSESITKSYTFKTIKAAVFFIETSL